MAESPSSDLPFTRKNWVMFLAGLAVIALGYICLSIPPAEGFFSLTLAPLLLVCGYCVLLPLAIMLREKGVKSPEGP